MTAQIRWGPTSKLGRQRNFIVVWWMTRRARCDVAGMWRMMWLECGDVAGKR